MSVSAEKGLLRKEFLRLRSSLLPQEKAALDASIASRVLQNDAYLSADTVLCYISLPDEIDTRPILVDAWERGKRVAVPRCEKGGKMDFYEISSYADLEGGMYGILEPTESCALVLPKSDDLCIVPCLAVDDRRSRLGYGGGYYDRYLSSHCVRTLGLCYASCLTRDLPHDAFDVQ